MATAVEKSNAYFLVSEVCKQAMTAAADKPGRYGGRYVGRRYNRAERRDDVFILDDDDPELYRDDETLDLIAQVTPKAVLPMGRCRYWLNSDGSINWGYFVDRPR